jgi:hypothetical protein
VVSSVSCLLRFTIGFRTRIIDTVKIAGVDIRIINPARTVVDMPHYRTKLGDEPVMETLKDFTAAGGDLNEVIVLADKLGWRRTIEAPVKAAEEFQTLIPRSGP